MSSHMAPLHQNSGFPEQRQVSGVPGITIQVSGRCVSCVTRACAARNERRFLFTGRKTVRKISVSGLILHEIHHISNERCFSTPGHEGSKSNISYRYVIYSDVGRFSFCSCATPLRNHGGKSKYRVYRHDILPAQERLRYTQ